MSRTDDRDRSGVDSLEQAISVFLAWQDAGGGDRDALLAQHPELRDLLEPMLAEDAAEPAAGTGIDVDPSDGAEGDRTLGDFRLVREIGRGGMGVVYEARQTSLNRRVAVKVLPALAALHPRSVARFRREAAVIARMDHPGIVDVVAVGQDDDTWYLAMELVGGLSLDRIVRHLKSSGRDPADVAAREVAGLLSAAAPTTESATETRRSSAWDRGYVDAMIETAAQVAESLQHAHESGVIHRDVKPSNIMLRADGRTVLMDFGLARDESLPAMTASGEFAGTPYYVSPEQALGQSSDLDHRTDVFSLGATLYELVTLRRPFDAASDHELLAVILRDQPVDPSRHTRAVGRDLAAVILKALEKEPGRRYQTAGKMAADLRALLEYRPVVARHASTWQRLRRWIRREPLRAALLTVLAVGVPAITALAGYLYARLPEIRVGQEQGRRDRLNDQLDRAALLGLLNEQEEEILVLEEAHRVFPDEFEVVGALAISLEYQARGAPRDGPHRHQSALRIRDLLASHEEMTSGSPFLSEIRAFAYRELGDTEGADALLDNLPPLSHSRDLLLMAQRVLAARRNESGAKRARRLVERVVLRSEHPSARALFSLAKIADRLRDEVLGRQVADAIDARFPDSRVARVYAAVASMAADPADARRRFSDLLTDAEGALHPWLSYHVALSYLREGRRDDARRHADSSLEQYPDSLYLLMLAGDLACKAADLETGLALLRRAVDQYPESVLAWEALVRTLTGYKRPQDALEVGRRALQRAPNSFEIRANMAVSAARMQQLDEAITLIGQARELAPEQPGLAINEANMRLARGELDEAEAIVRELIERDAELWQPWMILAEAAARREDLEEAARCYRNAMRRAPSKLQLVRNLVRHLERGGRSDMARIELERFAADHPSQSQGWAELTRFLSRSAPVPESAAARDLLEFATRTVATDVQRSPENLWLLARAHRLCGDADSAGATLTEARERMDHLIDAAGSDGERARLERRRQALEAAVQRDER